MKYLSWRALCCLTAFGVLGANASCSHEQTGLYIQGNVKLTAPDCIAQPEATSTLIDVGALDVALKLDYEASLLVGSQLTPRGDKANLRTESMVTTIEGAEVHLYTDKGDLDAAFTVPASGVIAPTSAADPGFGIIFATLIPQSSGAALAGQITDRSQTVTRVADVKVYGKTIGGLDIESSTLSYVIKVCKGCLVEFPALDPAGNCDVNGSATSTPTLPCRAGQDEGLDCRLCAGAGNNVNPYCISPANVGP
jgi:hypothetical protein